MFFPSLLSACGLAMLSDRRTVVLSTFATPLLLASDPQNRLTPSSSSQAIILPDSTTVSLTPSHHDGVTMDDSDRTEITLPMESCSGGVNCVRLVLTTDTQESLTTSTGDVLRIYRAIVDTGSPYLVFPEEDDDENDRFLPPVNTLNDNFFSFFSRWASPKRLLTGADELGQGGLTPLPMATLFRDSEYPPTEDVYGSKLGKIEWKQTRMRFAKDYENRLRPFSTNRDGSCSSSSSKNSNSHSSDKDIDSLVVGVMDDVLTNESGGCLLGLVKGSNPKANPNKVQLRPTFLEQECIVGRSTAKDEKELEDHVMTHEKENAIQAFSLDAPNRRLTLSNQPLTPRQQSSVLVLPLVDLRPLGDFVDHYTVLVEKLIIDNQWVFQGGDSLFPQSLNQQTKGYKFKRPIVAVFDSGLTGCVVTRPLWEELIQQSQKMGWAHPSEYVQLDVVVKAINDNNIQLTAPSIEKNSLVADSATTTATGTISTNIRKSTTANSKKESSNHRYQTIRAGGNVKSNIRLPPFYVDPIDLDWFDDESTAPYVVVLGQTFLSQGKLTIDIETRQAVFDV